MLIGLNGPAGSGKDTFAGFLVEKGFKRYSFAKAVKDAALALDPIVWLPMGTGEPGDGYARLSQIIAEQGWDDAKHNIAEVRRILQNLGTEVGRMILGVNCWVDIVARQWDEDGRPDAVITDLRFPNEAKWVTDNGGHIVRIERPNNPYDIGTAHASEQYEPQALITITNNGAIHHLASTAERLVDVLNAKGEYFEGHRVSPSV
jgi:hypothetical protein